MPLTATQLNYFHICRRKLWLFSRGIRMEHLSDLVKEGKTIEEHSYKKRGKRFTQIDLGNVKIDYFNTETRVIHEVKKSSKMEEAHIAQVQFYILMLEKAGIEVSGGLLEYPEQRDRRKVFLSDPEREQLEEDIREAEKLISLSVCPPKTQKRICRHCAYLEFCWADDED